MNSTVAERGLAVFADALDGFARALGQLFFDRAQRLIEFEIGVMLAGGADHQQAQAAARLSSD